MPGALSGARDKQMQPNKNRKVSGIASTQRRCPKGSGQHKGVATFGGLNVVVNRPTYMVDGNRLPQRSGMSPPRGHSGNRGWPALTQQAQWTLSRKAGEERTPRSTNHKQRPTVMRSCGKGSTVESRDTWQCQGADNKQRNKEEIVGRHKRPLCKEQRDGRCGFDQELLFVLPRVVKTLGGGGTA